MYGANVPGEDWFKGFTAAINASSVVVPLVSTGTLKSIKTKAEDTPGQDNVLVEW